MDIQITSVGAPSITSWVLTIAGRGRTAKDIVEPWEVIDK